MFCKPDRAPRQEERRRHDIELPAELAGEHQRLRNVGLFHVAEGDDHSREQRVEGFQVNPPTVDDAG